MCALSLVAAKASARRRSLRAEPALRKAYTRALRRAGQDAAERFQRAAPPTSLVAAAAGWHKPTPDEVYDLLLAQTQMRDTTRRARDELLAIQADVWGAVGLSFAETNPLLTGVFDRLGQKITAITESQRGRIMQVIDHAWADGLSIPDAAQAIRQATIIDSLWRSRMIARTEIIGASNGASLAAVRTGGAATYKVWLAANDQFVRPDHADADGQTVPIDQPFDVGGSSMMYPGDPSGPADEVCNCRCTLSYTEDEP